MVCLIHMSILGQYRFMQNHRLPKLLDLVSILQSGMGISLFDIMEELEISRSTAFRYLKILRESGIPYKFEQGRGYCVNASFFMPPVNLQTSEAAALMTLIRHASTGLPPQTSANAIKAIRKITASLPAAVRETCRSLQDQVTVMLPKVDSADSESERVSLLLHAIEQKRSVELEIICDKNSKRSIRMHPYHLICSDSQWLVVCLTTCNSEMMTLPLSCMTQLHVTESNFRRKKFDLQRYLGKAWRWQPEGTIYQVELAISNDCKHNLLDVQWHQTQCYEVLGDGTKILRFEVDGLNEIVDWIWEHGHSIVVHQPQELKTMLAERCKKMLLKLQD